MSDTLRNDPAWQAAFDRDQRRFLNDPDRCQDCRLVEACACGTRWTNADRER